jgi:bifunctional non-homologous end joining protein LigD
MTRAAKRRRPIGDLGRYRAKRDFAKTAEPRGGKRTRAGFGYLIQKHAASRLHYDFRLELDGVLKSWAVTRGPSLDPADKRLAVHVEDHPIEYGKFEGVIPKGQYGGGTVMLWDRGTWEPVGDPRQMYREGRLKFLLHGERLEGEWNLVRMRRRSPKDRHENWLLIKGGDEAAKRGDGDRLLERATRSVVSGLDMAGIAAEGPSWNSNRGKSEMCKEKPAPKAKARAALSRRRAKPLLATAAASKIFKRAGRAALPDFIPPQLATRVASPPDGAGWVHEIKLDGYRILARLESGRVKLLTRRGLDWHARFPEIAAAVAALPAGRALLDGEAIAIDAEGHPNFGMLQQALSDGPTDRLMLVLFDLLHLDGHDLRPLPLRERKELLAALLGNAPGVLRYSEHFANGPVVYHRTCEMKLEGLVSKRATDPYRSGRGLAWLKSKCRERQEFVIGGYTPPTAGNRGIGSLLLGYMTDRGLRYAGRVGTGFSDRSGTDLRHRLKPLERSKSPFLAIDAGGRRGARFVEPKLVAEVEFSNWTRDDLVRQAAFVGFREDKLASSIGRERSLYAGRAEAAVERPAALLARKKPASKSAPPRRSGKAPKPPAAKSAAKGGGDTVIEGVRLSHPEKPLYGKDGPTKRELAEYYLAVAELILPHVERRPLSIVRCPDGQGKPCFFQKHLAPGMPPAIEPMQVKTSEGVAEYVSISDPAGLVALVQFGVLEIHPWGSPPGDIESASRITIDLDPDPSVEWRAIIDGVRDVRDRLGALGLRSFLKTTGGKGLHVVAPLDPPVAWPVAKNFTKLLAERMAAEQPDRYVAVAMKRARKGKIFVDYLRNQREATAIAPYSTRARPGAPVSVPIEWEQLSTKLRSDRYRTADLPKQLARRKRDPWKDFFRVRQTIKL